MPHSSPCSPSGADTAGAAEAAVELAGRTGAQLLDAVLVGEDRELRDQQLRGLAQRRLRIDRAVRLDVERQLVEVGALADARLAPRRRPRGAPARRSSRSGSRPIGWSGDLLSSAGR